MSGNLIPEVINTDIEVVKEGQIRTPRFDGLISKISVGEYNDLTGDITIISWVNAKSSGENTTGTILDNAKLRIHLNSAARIYVYSDGAAYSYSELSSIKLDGTYHSVIITRSSSGVTTIYIDSVDFTVDNSSGTPAAGTEPTTIGNRDVGNRTWDGNIPELIILDGLLTPKEISQYYTSTKNLYNK
jgi:hypothetical protein